MGDANRVQVRYWAESSWGTGPTTEDMTEVRLTGESLNYNITNSQSSELRDDRQVTDVIQTGADATGAINFELSYNSYDDFLASALFSTWSSDLGISSSDMVAASNTFTNSGTVFENIVAGQWIKVAGFTGIPATNNGYFLVSVATGDSLTVTPSPVTEASGDTVTMVGATLSNGTTEKSFTIERYHTGLGSDVYFEYNGMVVNQFALTVAANQIITGSFEFVGKSASVGGTATSSGNITAANTNDVINAVSNVANFLEANAAVDAALVQSISITVNNNIRGKDAVGTLGNVDLGSGTIDVTGTLTAYFLDSSLQTKYIAGTKTSLSFRTTDNDGNVYIWTMHNVAIEAAPTNATGINTDVMQTLTFRAIRHSIYDNTIQIDKFAA